MVFNAGYILRATPGQIARLQAIVVEKPRLFTIYKTFTRIPVGL